MEHILRGQFGYENSLNTLLGYVNKKNWPLFRYVRTTFARNSQKYGSKRQFQRNLYTIWTGRGLDRSGPLLKQEYIYHKREYGMIIVRALRGVLKIRYLLIGGAVAGGGALQKVGKEK